MTLRLLQQLNNNKIYRNNKMGSRRKAPRRKTDKHSCERRTYLLVLKVFRYPPFNCRFHGFNFNNDILVLDVAVADLMLQMYIHGEMQRLTFLYLEDIGS